MPTVKRILKALRKSISKTRLKVRAAAGVDRNRWCPACREEVIGFFTYGIPNWGCPNCGASCRERFVNSCLDSGVVNIKPSCRVLHMAPSEHSLVRRFIANGTTVFGDLEPSLYRNTLSVERIDLMTMDDVATFDLIYASHVMEHVPNDRVALSNAYAHLSSGGQIWLLVPLHDGPTVDGPPDLSPRERERRFGQWDHLRQYGPDLRNRMEAVGFEVSYIEPTQFSAQERHKFGLWDGDKMFVGTK